MFNSDTISFRESGSLNQLVSDYLDKKPKTNSLYRYYPDLEGFKTFLSENTYNHIDRGRLADILLAQGEKVSNTSQLTFSNIELLRQAKTYTVTTGHQLCLFTGPLYFIYKIFSVINLAESLNEKFPENKFVPVYWMASEDHDFEEINHIHLFGKKISWETLQTGAVGDFSTQGLEVVLEEFRKIAGQAAYSEELTDLFSRAYLGHDKLADATRYLVNELFKTYGLVIVDGNDRNFKTQFTEVFEKDIFQHLAHEAIQPVTEYISENKYKVQVNPRQINCFYLEEQKRTRIDKNTDGNYVLTDSGQEITADEMKKIIMGTPEKLSPNVTLRPLYQQHILPNIAYVGGPGELAYWLEYKKMFETFGVAFPVLVPRQFITVIERNTSQKIRKLNLSKEDLFKTEQTLVNELQERSGNTISFAEEKRSIEKLYLVITEKINTIDPTLKAAAAAEQQKAEKGIETLEAKANKALKQRAEQSINQVRVIFEKNFPGGVPQERVENFSSFYLKFGPAFLEVIRENTQPLNMRHLLLTEN